MDMINMIRQELVNTNPRFGSLSDDDKQRVAEIYSARIASADVSRPVSFEDIDRFNDAVYAEFGV